MGLVARGWSTNGPGAKDGSTRNTGLAAQRKHLLTGFATEVFKNGGVKILNKPMSEYISE